jgi:putative hemolysin
MSWYRVLTSIVIVCGLILLSALFSSSETAFLSLQRTRLAHMVDEGLPGAARVQRLLDQPRTLLSAILVGNNLTNTAATAVGTALALDLMRGDGQAVIVATAVITVLLVVFGEVVPKGVALGHAFGVSRLYALPMSAWVRIVRPVTWLLDHLSRLTLRLLGGADEADATLTAAELRTAIRLGAEAGRLEEMASSHLLRVLRLHQRQVQEIMVPRVDMVAVPVTMPLRDAARALARSGFLRLPVYDGAPDEVVGYLHVSDLHARLLDGLEGRAIRDVMRPVRYESEHASIATVLALMQAHATYLLMLVDEFGATAGLVTLEDIIEEVIGEVPSESGYEVARTAGRPGTRHVLEGSTLLADLSRTLGADLAVAGANTVAGLLLARLQRFPAIGETVDHEGFRFTILEADPRRIIRVAVEPIDTGGTAAAPPPAGPRAPARRD